MGIGFINGEFVDLKKAVIPIEERGHQFGDGVYEVVKVYDSVPFLLNEHLLRLEKSAAAIQIKRPYTLDEMKEIIKEGIEKSKLADAEVYFQITRGIAPRTHLFPDVKASFSMTVKPCRHISKHNYDEGIPTVLVKDDRWANCYIKSLNLLPNILAKQNAFMRGSFEAIFVRDGYVTEGSSSNVFAVKDQVLYTTPLNSNILPGITREVILSIAAQKKIVYLEENFTQDFLKNADEAFITSTSVELLPIRMVDDQMIGDGNPGPISIELYKAFKNLYSSVKV